VHVDQCLYSVYQINILILLLRRIVSTVVSVITYHRTFARTDDKNNIRNGLSFSVLCASRLKSPVAVGFRLRRQLIDDYYTRRRSAIGKIVAGDQPSTLVYIDFPNFFYLLLSSTTTDDATSHVGRPLASRDSHWRRTSACHPLWRFCVSVVHEKANHLIVVVRHQRRHQSEILRTSSPSAYEYNTEL